MKICKKKTNKKNILKNKFKYKIQIHKTKNKYKHLKTQKKYLQKLQIK